MASSVLVGLKAIFDDKGIKDAQREFAKLGKGLKTSLGALGVGVGLGALAAGIKEATKAAVEDQKSQELLANQLRNTVGASDEQIASVENSIRAMQMQAAVADDVIRPAFASLVRSTGDVGQATALTSLALDVAAGTGKDLGAVSLALGKAINGSATSLQKLVPSIKGASDPMAELSKQFDGAAEAAANNDPFQRLSITLGELQESLGQVFIPMINGFASQLASADFAISFNNLVIAIQNAGIALDNLFKKVSGKGALNTIVDVAGAAAVGVAELAFWLADVGTTVGYLATGQWGKAGEQMGTFFTRYNNFVQDIYDQQDKAAAQAKANAGKPNPFLESLLPGGGAGGTKTVAKSVKTLYDTILEENRKQMARIRLGKIGIEGSLAEAIIGSGSDWYKTYQEILNSSETALGRLKKSWANTAAGIAESTAKMQEDYDKMVEGLQDALAKAQAEFDKFAEDAAPTVVDIYKSAKADFDALKASSDDFAKGIKATTDGLLEMTKIAEPIGQFESQVVSSFQNIQSSLENALNTKLITSAAYADLSAWAKREMSLMQDVARQRDALAKKISLAEAVYDDAKTAILAYGNINSALKSTSQTVTETQTKMVNGLSVSLTKTVEQVSQNNLVDQYKAILQKTKDFAASLNTLKKMGLNKDLFKQIVDAGVDAGGDVAQGIIAGGQASVTELNGVFTELAAVGDAVGETTAVVLYNNGVDVMGGFINGMKAQEAALAATAQSLAATFASEFADKLKTALADAIKTANDALVKALGDMLAARDKAAADLAAAKAALGAVTVPGVQAPVIDNTGDYIPVGRGAGSLGFKGGTSLVDGGTTVFNVTVTNNDPNAVVDALRTYSKRNGTVLI